MTEPHQQFTISADVYDIIYGELVDYGAHADHIASIIEERRPGARSVLEMACGTGQVLGRLAERYDVVGADISAEMLEVCGRTYPSIELHQGDYAELDLGRPFDAVLCLFSSIGYVRTPDRLAATLSNLAAHASPGGVVIVDGWLRPEAAIDGFRDQQSFEKDGVLVSRSMLAFVRDGETDMYAGHLVNDGYEIRAFIERHQMGLFDDSIYLAAMAEAGLTGLAVVEGFDDRGRFIGTRPPGAVG